MEWIPFFLLILVGGIAGELVMINGMLNSKLEHISGKIDCIETKLDDIEADIRLGD